MARTKTLWGDYLRRIGIGASAVQCRPRHLHPWRVLRGEPLEQRTLLSTTYYVDALSGQNSNPGTLESPWQTVDKVNSAALSAGDTVLFHRGQDFRGSLCTQSGSEAGGRITYGAYGEGEKPRLLGSIEKNNPSDWTETTPDSLIWTTKTASQCATITGNLILNPSFDTPAGSPSDTTPAANWTFSDSPSNMTCIRDTASSDYDSGPACLKITSSTTTPTSSTKLSTTNTVNVTNGQMYQLTFRARVGGSGQTFAFPSVQLQNSSGASIATNQQTSYPTFTTAWTEYTVTLKATSSISNAKIVFTLGGGSGMKANSTFYIDSLSFSPELLPNPSFVTNVAGWVASPQPPASSLLYANRLASTYDSAPACYKLTAGANTGDSFDDIALRTNAGLSVVQGQYYRLTFRAKGSTNFSLHSIDLQKLGSPTVDYSSCQTRGNIDVTNDWQAYTVFFRSDVTASDAALAFNMGRVKIVEGEDIRWVTYLPSGASFYVDSLSLTKCDLSAEVVPFQEDIGNIIFNNSTCGWKRWTDTDDSAHFLYVADPANPSVPAAYSYHLGLHNQGDF
jgi:hypothetical protein